MSLEFIKSTPGMQIKRDMDFSNVMIQCDPRLIVPNNLTNQESGIFKKDIAGKISISHDICNLDVNTLTIHSQLIITDSTLEVCNITCDCNFAITAVGTVTETSGGQMSLVSDSGIDIGKTGIITTVKGALNVDEATTLDTTLGVTGATTLGVLGAGASTLASAAVTGNATVAGTLGVTGDSTIAGTLGVIGNSTFAGTLGVGSELTAVIINSTVTAPVAPFTVVSNAVVTNLTADFANNASGTLAAEIATNVADIATNVTGIAANTSGVAANVTAIAANTSGVAANVTAIAANVTDIAANVTDIAANKAAIVTNVADIATNVADIATNVTNIATNTTAIGNLLVTGSVSPPTSAPALIGQIYVDTVNQNIFISAGTGSNADWKQVN